MPSTYTQSGVELIGNGEQSGTWGTTTNTNLQILDRMISQAGTITLSGTTHTLTISDGVLSDGQYGVLVFGGSPSGANTVTINPNDAQRTYIVKNDSGESVVLTQGSGGNVTVADGRGAIVYCDGAGSGAEVVDLTAAFISTLASLGVTASAAELNQLDGNAFTGDLTIPDKIIHAGDTNTSIRFPAADTVSVETAGSERVRVDSSGNVGIGTSSPNGTITMRSVFPRIDFLESDGSAGFNNTILIRSGDVFSVQTRGDDAFVSNDYRITSNASGALTHEWRIGNAEAMRVDSSGNVGIGTSSPTSDLHIAGTAGSKIQLQSTSGVGGGFIAWHDNLGNRNKYIGTSSNATEDFLIWQESANDVRIATNDAERMRIDSAGNVGIGTTNPSEALDVDGTVKATGLNLGGTAVTATAAELNILDGVTATAAELNILDGVTWTLTDYNTLTATAAELNILDGVTASTTELNILDGVTASTAELNILDGVTATTAELNILDGVTWTLTDYNTLTATAAELNILDGVTASTAELNILDGVTADATELNILDGVTATTAELNILDGVTGLSGSDTEIVTGTAGTNGQFAQWNADGDIVGVAAPSGGPSGSANTPSRSFNTAYQNTQGKPILLAVELEVGGGRSLEIQISPDGSTWYSAAGSDENRATVTNESYNVVVPDTWRYRLFTNSATISTITTLVEVY